VSKKPLKSHQAPSRLSELEVDPCAEGYRTICLSFSVHSYSDHNALEIGFALLDLMREENIVGKSDGTVVMGPI